MTDDIFIKPIRLKKGYEIYEYWELNGAGAAIFKRVKKKRSRK